MEDIGMPTREDNRSRYYHFIENMPDGFVYLESIINNDGKTNDYVFLEANKSFEQLMGLKRDKVLGKRVTKISSIGQIAGFLVIENGLFVTAMFATEGMPLIVDLGIFIDLITAVLIMGILVFRINERFETTDTDKLRKLRG
jgi:hypothetical protein